MLRLVAETERAPSLLWRGREREACYYLLVLYFVIQNIPETGRENDLKIYFYVEAIIKIPPPQAFRPTMPPC